MVTFQLDDPNATEPSTLWVRGYVDPKTGQDDEEEIFEPTGNRIPTPSSSPWPIAIPIKLAGPHCDGEDTTLKTVVMDI
jgi:hypothetical protein